jgi:DNA-binding MarR family transcriptional regulator
VEGMDKARSQNEASDAVRLAMAVSRLRSRIRIEAGLRSTGIPISQLAVLGRIIDEGPTTAAALAAGEHVTQQAIAQSLATLKERGLVAKQTDPSDGRKSLVTATAAGRELRESLTASREEWLTRAIDAAVTPEERPLLGEAIELLERIADVELHRGGEIR